MFLISWFLEDWFSEEKKYVERLKFPYAYIEQDSLQIEK